MRTSAGIAVQWPPLGLFRFSLGIPLKYQHDTCPLGDQTKYHSSRSAMRSEALLVPMLFPISTTQTWNSRMRSNISSSDQRRRALPLLLYP